MKMLTNNDKITVSQTVALLITTMLATGILALPRNVANKAGSDGWLLVLFAGVLSFFSSMIVGALVKKFPRDTFIEYSQKVLGKIPGYFLGIILILYFLFISAMSVRVFSEVMNAFMLINTPRGFIIATMLITSAYIMRHGIEPIARAGEILLPVLVFPIFAMYLTALPRADFSELLPFLDTPAKTLAIGTVQNAYNFLGFEILLMVGPYMRSPERVMWALLFAMGFITLMYLFIVVIVFASIGVEDTRILLWPAMSIIRTIMAPGGVFERLDALALALWTIASFTTINGMYYAGTLAAAHLAGVGEFKFFVTIFLPWVYLISTIPGNPLDTMRWTQISGVAGLVIAVIIPAIVLAASTVRKKGGSAS
ncbi:MAG: spore germination protein [Tepidanaerobacteraceae bacterium]|nr:spore germination protein [Tepidanaerobacteraceae bacterium]